jgi:aryl-alcohol dehydrogenase-like predicted oxidoreductase
MESRILDASGVRLSRLGFGCGSLTTHERRSDAVRLLREAFDAGITHFDVARLYGLGQAESILGEFLRAVPRDRVTVATKFGLDPPVALASRPALLRFGKRVLRFLPGLRAMAHRTVGSQRPAPRYSIDDAMRSLETSLKELGSEYVDLLLLHEADLADASGSELLDHLEREVRAGRIRAYGVASHTSRLGWNLAAFPPGHAVFQFNNAAVDAEIARLEGTADKLLITHSALAPLKDLRSAMAEREAFVREWSIKIDADLADERVVAQLLMDYALHSNDRGVVLFSTMRDDHLRENVRRALGSQHSVEQTTLFCRCCRLLVTDNTEAVA